ncbi:hypothetical protein GTR04_4577 [Trichophyton interdigitale]|nr:hypothetical protein GTR04_4577 [Trichophyton interdigitale]
MDVKMFHKTVVEERDEHFRGRPRTKNSGTESGVSFLKQSKKEGIWNILRNLPAGTFGQLAVELLQAKLEPGVSISLLRVRFHTLIDIIVVHWRGPFSADLPTWRLSWLMAWEAGAGVTLVYLWNGLLYSCMVMERS